MALEVVIITGHIMKLVQCYIGDVFHFEKKTQQICNVAARHHSVLLSFNFYKLSIINARVQITFPLTSFVMVTVEDDKYFELILKCMISTPRQGRSVNMETSYEQDSNSGRLRDLSHFHHVQTSYGAHPTSYPMGIRNISLR